MQVSYSKVCIMWQDDNQKTFTYSEEKDLQMKTNSHMKIQQQLRLTSNLKEQAKISYMDIKEYKHSDRSTVYDQVQLLENLERVSGGDEGGGREIV